MKKMMVLSVGALLLLSSCGSYTGAGAYAGGSFGSIIGSAIGGIAGGPRGSDIGTLIGMAGGAAVGAAIGAKADEAEQKKYEEYRMQREQRRAEQRSYEQRTYSSQSTYSEPDNSGFDATNSGDDRLYGFGEDFSTVEPAESAVSVSNALEIRNPRLVDSTRDNVLSRGEEARMVFEVFNISSKPVFGIRPSVMEVTGNRHIRISENVLVESIAPGKGIRYTAVIKADNSLKDGEAIIRIGLMQGNKDLVSQAREFRLQTSKR